MCGIAGLYVPDPERSPFMGRQEEIEAFTNGLLLGIEPRGHDATGVVSLGKDSNEAKLCKADTFATSFVNWRDSLCPDPMIVMCHTRFATKGTPMNLDNNHPVQYGSVFVTHNGHISNDDELFEEHELNRIAEVDTEIIPAMLDLKGINKAHLALQTLIGNFAIAAIDPVRFPNTLLLAKGQSSPLEYIQLPGGTTIWASTQEAIKKAWNLVWPSDKFDHRFMNLNPGDLLLFEDGKSEKFRFEVRRPEYKSYSGAGSGHSSQYSSGPYLNIGDSRLRDLCTCGEFRYWHSGNDYSGPCLKKSTMAGNKFRSVNCDGYTSIPKPQLQLVSGGSEDTGTKGESNFRVIDNETGEIIEYRTCLGCHEIFAEDEMTSICGHLVCANCNGEAEEYEDYDDEGDPNDPFVEDEIIEVAEELGLKVKMVEYLLYEAEDKDFDNDPWLIQLYCAVDTAYSEALKRNKKNQGRQMTIAEAFEGCDEVTPA